ncbi:MAG: cell division protein FtsQ/DivIB [Sulfitobacter sp.]
MQQMIRRKRQSSRSDPAPSRWSWKLQRLMLTPAFLFTLKVGVPCLLAFGAGLIWLSDEGRRTAIWDTVADARTSIETRPEFMVQMMAIDGADAQVATDIRDVVPLDFPVSSFDLKLEDIRATIAKLDPVQAVTVRIRPGGVLHVTVKPRIPVAIWRGPDGLTTVDRGGVHIAKLASREDMPLLPLIAGAGADGKVAEALQLMEAVGPLGPRLRGIVRVGERRWDIVLDRDQRILLPEVGPRQALERVIALEGAQDILSRDVARVDMRLAQRPTMQMNETATLEWWNIQETSGQ